MEENQSNSGLNITTETFRVTIDAVLAGHRGEKYSEQNVAGPTQQVAGAEHNQPISEANW